MYNKNPLNYSQDNLQQSIIYCSFKTADFLKRIFQVLS